MMINMIRCNDIEQNDNETNSDDISQVKNSNDNDRDNELLIN